MRTLVRLVFLAALPMAAAAQQITNVTPSRGIAIGALTLDGLIRHERSSMLITDREGLENRACECYRVMRDTDQRS